jgi:sugar phosphate isomerase/epimerase
VTDSCILSVRAALPILIVFAAALWIGGSEPADDARPGSEAAAGRLRAPVRGVIISCQSWGWEWGSDAMIETMSEVKALGATWIAIHPYAGIRADGRVVMHPRWYTETRWLTRPIAEAHRLGLKIMIKPHLAYWGSPFSWRGEIQFETDEQWQRFFETYEAWITQVARICADADAFVVGTELDRTIHHTGEWRRIIQSVRKLTPAPLTYSANWTDYQRVRFWGELDAIGVQAYFPLAKHTNLPEPKELDEAWKRVLDQLAAYAKKHDRKVLLAELGYNRSSRAAMEPWSSRSGGEHAEETQRRCLTAALQAVSESDVVAGAFLWKWFPGHAGRANFLMSTPAMKQVIKAQWAQESDE